MGQTRIDATRRVNTHFAGICLRAFLGLCLALGGPATAAAATAGILISPSTLADATNGDPYSQTFTAAGGVAPYTFTISAGSLPPGLTLAPGGLLSGTPSPDGTYSFTITATDSVGFIGSRAYSLLVNPSVTVLPTTVPVGTIHQPYSVTFSATGATSPYTFSLSGTLPAGLAMDSSGALSGTPLQTGTFAFSITATDATSDFFGTRSYSLKINAPNITLAPASLPGGIVGTDYTQPLSASGGIAPYTFAVTAGALPAGMAMDSDGIIDSTPEESGSFPITVTATDAFGDTGSRAYTLAIAAPTIVLEPASLPDAVVGMDYEQVLGASGGTAPYTYAVTAGALPPGLFLSSDGTLNGAATATGTFAFTATATDNYNQTGERDYAITVDAPTIILDPASLAAGVVGSDYAQPITASGGTAPYSYAITAGALPAGMAMDSDGIIDSTPEEAGSFPITVTATDAFGQTGSHAYTLTVGAPTIVLDPASLPDAVVGMDYEQVVGASGGNAPYTFAVTAGALPPGLSFGSDGTLNGAATATGTFAFTVTATDNYNQTGEQAYAITVGAPTIVLCPSSLPDAVVGVDYQQLICAEGGTAPYSFTVTSGTLPPGLTLGSDDTNHGALHGAPTVAGTYAFTITATDSYDQTGGQAYSITIGAPTITLAPGTLPAAIVGDTYGANFTATGGTAPYTFAVTDGALPAGLALDSAGAISGAPTADGDFAFTITATDAFEQSGSQEYTLAISAPALPDPTTDPEVKGLLASQVSTVRTFVGGQILNVHERLELLHDRTRSGWGFWIAGSVRSGDRNGNDAVSPASFETSGMTGGTDFRFNNDFTFGGGLGFARDRTAVGNDGSRLDARAPSGVSYMSWKPQESPYFIDGIVGVQRLDFDVQRYSEAAGEILQGRRQGTQRFTSWSSGYEHRTDTFLFSPYARVDAANARLDGFSETGDNPYALQYGPQDVDLRTTTVGFRMNYRMQVPWGVLEPRMRVEYQRDFHDEDGISIRYANQESSPVFFTAPAGMDANRTILEIGTLLRSNWHGLLFRIDYLGVFGGGTDNEHELRFSMQDD